MLDLELEIARSLVMAGFFGAILWFGLHRGLHRLRGGKLLIAGFLLILLGSLIDITDNFDSLGRFRIFGDTTLQAVLEKELGYLGGFLLLVCGFWSWLPQMLELRACEALLARLSKEFIDLAPQDVDRQAAATLEAIGKFTGVERVYVFTLTEEGDEFRSHHEWWDPSAKPATWEEDEPTIRCDRLTWGFARLLEGEPIVIERGVHDLPPEAEHERQVFLRKNPRSKVIVPIRGRGELLGFAGLDCYTRKRRWPPELISHLRVVGEILAGAILRVRAEEKLRRREAQLAHVSRLSTLGELVASIAHELKQPLYAITNFAEACDRVLPEDEEHEQVREWTGNIHRAARQANDILQRLRDFARTDTKKLEELEIDEVLVEAVDLLISYALRYDIDLRLEGGTGRTTVRGDRTELQQVFVNLLQNACEAIRDHAGAARDVVVNTSADTSHVVVSVCDGGPGLDPSQADRVFEPFVTTKPEGMGMGLAISRTIVEAHGGRLWASAREHEGACFSIELPASQQSDAE